MTQATARLSWEGDVCVIGAGPAGSTMARQLLVMGYRVCVVDARRFPRPHVGESLTPGVLPMLESLGLRETIAAAGFLRPERAIVLWSGREELKPLMGVGLQVDRGHFDSLLLAAAHEKGAYVLCETRASRPQPDGSGFSRVPIRIEGGRTGELRARFIVDASGRRALLGGEKQRTSAPTIALYGYWRGARIEGVESRIEAASDGWYWGAPLPDGTVVAAVFMDSDRMAAAHGPGLQGFYCDMLARSRLLSGCLNGTLASRVVACDAASYTDPSPVGDGWIKVGEASVAIDPLSSQGVEVAMVSGIQAAVAVDTILSDPARAPLAAQFYSERQREIAAQHQALAAQRYAESAFRGGSFWDRRAVDAAGNAIQPPPPPARQNAPPARRADPRQDRITRSPELRIITTQVLTEAGMTTTKALEHPRLKQPVAYLGGVPLAPLVEEILDGDTVDDLLEKWSRRIPERVSRSIFEWFRARGLLVVNPSGKSP
jgi:flavin-dependent dehydrogenase